MSRTERPWTWWVAPLLLLGWCGACWAHDLLEARRTREQVARVATTLLEQQSASDPAFPRACRVLRIDRSCFSAFAECADGQRARVDFYGADAAGAAPSGIQLPDKELDWREVRSFPR